MLSKIPRVVDESQGPSYPAVPGLNGIPGRLESHLPIVMQYSGGTISITA